MTPPLRRYLTSLAAAGVRRMPRGVRQAIAVAATEPEAAPDASTPSSATPAAPYAAGDPASAQAALTSLAQEIAGCNACSLCETRTRTVPGEGNPQADIVFVGEGPGADEDRSGRPFVGKAGQLLEDIVNKGMKLQRSDVFILNTVKCRPPGNRNPLPEESAACRGFLERQLEILQPKVICALGNVAAHLLLDTELSMNRLRQGQHHWRQIPVIPTYHPAYLLRNASAKRPTWEDIQRVMEMASRA